MSAICRAVIEIDFHIPELLVLHIRHVIVVRILKRLRNTALISLFVLPGADEAVE